MDTVAQWEASHALKGAAEALIADMLRAIAETGLPDEVATIFAERLERLMQASGLPIGVAMNEACGRKNLDTVLAVLEASCVLPPSAFAEIRADLGRTAGGKSPAIVDRALVLALVPAIPLPEYFEDPTAALARVPAIPLPEHFDDAREPIAAEAGARTREGAAHTDLTEEVSVVAEAEVCVAEGPAHTDLTEQASVVAEAEACAAEGPAHTDLTEQASVVAEAEACAAEGPARTEETEKAAATAEATARAPARPAPLDEPDKATMRSVVKAAAALGIKLSTHRLRTAARMVEQVRRSAGRVTHRAVRFRGPVHRRPRASRAPRRAVPCRAAAPARDGPPRSDDAPPPPVASRSQRGAIGGAR